MKICPYCKKEIPAELAAARFRPFCSERCKLADLGDWASGKYAVPVVELDDVEEIPFPERDEMPEDE